MILSPTNAEFQFGISGHPGATLPKHWLVRVRDSLGLSDSIGNGIYLFLIAIGFIVFLIIKTKAPAVAIAGLMFLLTLALMRAGLIAPVWVLAMLMLSAIIVFLSIMAKSSKGAGD